MTSFFHYCFLMHSLYKSYQTKSTSVMAYLKLPHCKGNITYAWQDAVGEGWCVSHATPIISDDIIIPEDIKDSILISGPYDKTNHLPTIHPANNLISLSSHGLTTPYKDVNILMFTSFLSFQDASFPISNKYQVTGAEAEK